MMRSSFCRALSVSALRRLDVRDIWTAARSKPGTRAPRLMAVGRLPPGEALGPRPERVR